MSEELTRSGEGIFKPSRRGYAREEVDAYVAQLHRQIHDLQAQASSPDAAVRHALERVGGEIAGILQHAHSTAGEIVAVAEREAEAHRASAAEHAAQVTESAAQNAAEVTASAEEHAARVTSAAEKHAAEVTASAEKHAAEVTAAAEQRVYELDLDTDRIWSERERIVADARDLARQLQAVADLAAERFPEDPQTAAGSRSSTS
jgi:cell division septum initiation protein DivIVA